jgi:hypothetical protein
LGKCTATCMGADGACGNVSCAGSCQCDVNCDAASNTCPATMICPDPSGPDVCVDTMQACDSTVNTNKCQKCQ